MIRVTCRLLVVATSSVIGWSKCTKGMLRKPDNHVAMTWHLQRCQSDALPSFDGPETWRSSIDHGMMGAWIYS
ncbi:MAG: hypothetical protein CMJ41_00195 [Phycisphaerae bacterium]|nr:hypothetical protein [Phycisphaerae bacterium]